MRRLSRKKSKRVSLRRKHQIVKKASEAKKKMRKEVRRMARQGIKGPTKKDPGIPNLCPQKKELLQDMQTLKQIENDHKKEVRARMKSLRETSEFADLTSEQPVHTLDSSLESLVAASDLIIEVLDGRDPHPSPQLYNLINGSLPHIYLLNKSDLLSQDQCEKWQARFSKETQCILFKCPPTDIMKQVLLDYIEDLQVKTVSIMGYPNSGKSSVVNAIRGNKVASVSKMPGGTKKVEEFLIGDVTYLDTPGLENCEKGAVAVLRATNFIDDLKDPYTPVQGVLELCPKEKLLIMYAIPDFKDIKEFLTHIAKKMGKVAKGGMPDFDASAKIVLHDWFLMKIPFIREIN